MTGSNARVRIAYPDCDETVQRFVDVMLANKMMVGAVTLDLTEDYADLPDEIELDETTPPVAEQLRAIRAQLYGLALEVGHTESGHSLIRRARELLREVQVASFAIEKNLHGEELILEQRVISEDEEEFRIVGFVSDERAAEFRLWCGDEWVFD